MFYCCSVFRLSHDIHSQREQREVELDLIAFKIIVHKMMSILLGGGPVYVCFCIFGYTDAKKSFFFFLTNTKISQVVFMLVINFPFGSISPTWNNWNLVCSCIHIFPAKENQVLLERSSNARVGNAKTDENRSDRRRRIWVTLFSPWQLWSLVETAHWCELCHDLFITSPFHFPAFVPGQRQKPLLASSKTFCPPCSRNDL